MRGRLSSVTREHEIVCGECGDVFVWGNLLKKFCEPCASKRQKEKSKQSQMLRKKKVSAFAPELAMRKKLAGCCLCGYSEHGESIDFHHCNEKRFLVNTNTILTRGAGELIEEASKCALVCCRCHREIHLGIKENPKPMGFTAAKDILVPVIAKLTNNN
jgi:hypothetical protein